MPAQRATLGVLCGWGAVAAGVLGLAGALPVLSIGWAALAAAGYALVLVCAARARVPLAVLWGLTLVLRLAGLATGPVLSDDLHRYVWEGELVRRGLDPYAHAPNAPELDTVRRELPTLHASVNHPDVSAAYPPLAQGVHAAIVVVARATTEDWVPLAELLVRLVYLGCDLGVFALLLVLCARRGRSTTCAAAWGFCPLLAFEFGGSGHLDSLGIVLLLAAWTSSGRQADARSAFALAAAVLVKFLPVVALAGWIRERRPAWRALVPAGLVLGAGACLLFVSRNGFGGLGEYASRWEGFNLAFRCVHGALSRWRGPDANAMELAHDARVVCAALWMLVVGAAWLRWKNGLAFTRAAIGAFLVLTPVLHPWYLAWIVPFVALDAAVAWGWLVAVAPLLYTTLAAGRARGNWTEPGWLWPVVAVPFAGLALVAWWRARSVSTSRSDDRNASCADR